MEDIDLVKNLPTPEEFDMNVDGRHRFGGKSLTLEESNININVDAGYRSSGESPILEESDMNVDARHRLSGEPSTLDESDINAEAGHRSSGESPTLEESDMNATGGHRFGGESPTLEESDMNAPGGHRSGGEFPTLEEFDINAHGGHRSRGKLPTLIGMPAGEIEMIETATRFLGRHRSIRESPTPEESARREYGGHRSDGELSNMGLPVEDIETGNAFEGYTTREEWSTLTGTAQQTTTTESAVLPVNRFDAQRKSCGKYWQNLKNFLDRHVRSLMFWKKIFVTSCALAVMIDPLFFYIPMVVKEMKCIGRQKNLTTITLCLRELTDFLYLVDIYIIFHNEPKVLLHSVKGRSYLHTISLTNGYIIVEDAWLMAKRFWGIGPRIRIHSLALLPIPQVIIFIFLDSSSLNTMKFLSFLALVQYVPRTLRFYLSSTQLNKTPGRETERWIYFQAAFSFFLYILTSHVLGAFWYFLAIQREATCWKHACQSDNGCKPSTFYCSNHVMKNNITMLNDFCAVNQQDATSFDFGMFFGAIQSGVLESTNFPKKFSHCFWWGLRNLSSLGQNMQTSIYTWENIFAVFIALSGLIVFIIYLTANLKVCMQLVNSRSTKVKMIRQMKMKVLEVQIWLSANDIPRNMKTVIMEYVHKLEKDRDVNVGSIISILPLNQKQFIKHHLCLPMLMTVPVLGTMDEPVLKAICNRLKPVSYTEDTYIIQEGEPLVKMLFITQGHLLSYRIANLDAPTTSSEGYYSNTIPLGKGDFYGEELINWASTFSSFFALPVSSRSVKSLTKVEAFALTANDLEILVSKLWWHFSKLKYNSTDPSSGTVERVEHLAGSSTLLAWRRRRLQRTISSRDPVD